MYLFESEHSLLIEHVDCFKALDKGLELSGLTGSTYESFIFSFFSFDAYCSMKTFEGGHAKVDVDICVGIG